jgi:hypothetical protein
MYGQQVYSGQNVSQLSTMDFKDGFYVISVYSSTGEVFTNKIVIEN